MVLEDEAVTEHDGRGAQRVMGDSMSVHDVADVSGCCRVETKFVDSMRSI